MVEYKELVESIARIAIQSLMNSVWQGVLITITVLITLKLFKRINAGTRYGIKLFTLILVFMLIKFSHKIIKKSFSVIILY